MKGDRINFGQLKEVLPIPDLVNIQTQSYADFLQMDVDPMKRAYQGLQKEFMDTFPSKESGNRNAIGIEFIKYELRDVNLDLQELLKAGKTYQANLYVTFQMRGASSKDIHTAEINMGHIPLMTPSGSFIINGAERVIVSQLHKSPGICFERTRHASGTQLWNYKIIADHGSWLEVQFDIKGLMHIYLDRKRRRRKFLVSTFMRAFGYNSNLEVMDAVYGVKERKVAALMKEEDCARYVFAEDVTDPQDSEVTLGNVYDALSKPTLEMLKDAGVEKIKIVDTNDYGTSFIECLRIDETVTQKDAQKEIYKRMRPSDPYNELQARQLFERMFLDERHYDLGLVGRYKLNQTLGVKVNPSICVLTKEDIAAATRQLMYLSKNNENSKPDDIDHLSRRRIRTVGELLENQCRVGLVRVATNAKENLTKENANLECGHVNISSLIHPKNFSKLVDEFFQHNQLCQFMDQINCLSELTNKRRLSALGPGGLARDRAGTAVRDVHSSHYGRICPIETPEGPNIGLINSLALYAKLDEFGFIMTPYCKVKDGAVVMDKKGNPDIIYMKADDEEQHYIAQANAPRDAQGRFINPMVLGRHLGEAGEFPADKIDYIDVSPKQMISAAASVITFLEHDDANRALMGCNMQRQAVPLMRPERPLVGTGMEAAVARYSHAIQSASKEGIVVYADGFKIIVTPDGKLPENKSIKSPDGKQMEARSIDDYKLNIDDDDIQVYILYKFMRSNASTLVNQRPIVHTGDKVVAGQPLADSSCTDEGELALGRNVLVAFMSWCGYNYEDAIIISEKLVQDDVYTSVHINMQEVETRDTNSNGREEITRDIPNTNGGQDALRNLDTEGVVRVGAEVHPGDILVGKVSPKDTTDLAPEERLLKAIFGEKSSDFKDTSLKTENGCDGIVIDHRIERQPNPEAVKLTRQEIKTSQNETRNKYKQEQNAIIDDLVKELSVDYLGEKLRVPVMATVDGEPSELIAADHKITKLMLNKLAQHYDDYTMDDGDDKTKIDAIVHKYRSKLRQNEQCCQEAVALLQRNEGAQSGSINKVRVFIASKRRISIGDKMAGRHGNKGIVSKIVKVQDLPFMADGTPVEIILNPVGVPSRMNIGQVFETHAGWAARILGINVATPAFDGLPEKKLLDILERARMIKIAQAAEVEIPENITLALRKVSGKEPTEALARLRKMILDKGWKLGERNDAASTGGFIVDPNGIDRTEDFVDLDGKVRVYDGRTGEPFAQRVMVGQIYMLKLDHLVVNKIHARNVGPYSLVTQQPLGGKAQHGGQRFGEMEVWALEAYGAAYTLQEMLTVKSDDVDGREKIIKSIHMGQNELSANVPESFNVLLREINGLCLDVRINQANGHLA